MRALILESLAPFSEQPEPLRLAEVADPVPGPGQVGIRVHVCGVCHTELDEIEGRAPPPTLPVIPGHQVVGTVTAAGSGVDTRLIGTRVGVAWIASACGRCRYCLRGEENLCPEFRATGRDVNGGYAEFMTVRAEYVYAIPGEFSDLQAAPLLCAGAIGHRSLRLARMQDGVALGLTGFGSSGHLVLQEVCHRFPRARVYVFARSGEERRFALDGGAAWAGDTSDHPPELLDAVIDTTPAWTPVVAALRVLAPGGRLVVNAIRKEAGDASVLQSIDYATHLWMEKEIKSVANVTRVDVREFLDVAASARIVPEVEEFSMGDANRALRELKERHVRGAKVLRISGQGAVA
jgi:propanol-preferring alcohol dehydrogenase